MLVEHGYTHQWDGGSNPYDGMTGDDVEFYRVTESDDGQIHDVGPLPEDSGRLDGAPDRRRQPRVRRRRDLPAQDLRVSSLHGLRRRLSRRRASLRRPLGAQRLLPRAARRRPDPVRATSRDSSSLRRARRLREQGAAREPRHDRAGDVAHVQGAAARRIIRAARANLVVRDGFASFYFHPFLELEVPRSGRSRGSRRRLHLRQPGVAVAWRSAHEQPALRRTADESATRDGPPLPVGISCGVESHWESGFTAWLGLAEEAKAILHTHSLEEAAAWLDRAARQHYPTSTYAAG